MVSQTEHKICARCKQSKPLSEFSRTKDGKRTAAYCRICHSEHQLDKLSVEEIQARISKHRKEVLRLISYLQKRSSK